MLDCFNRTIDCLRISVTETCNLRCYYCVPKNNEVSTCALSQQATQQTTPQVALLSLDEILEVVTIGAKEFGLTKIKLTGGEPLTRPDLVNIVAGIAMIPEIEDISMTTNAVLLGVGGKAQQLKDAGLNRVNISLDSVNELRFSQITGGGKLDLVLKGIAMAQEVGLSPIKLNCVVEKSSDELDAQEVRAWAEKQTQSQSQSQCQCLTVRYIRRMNLERGEFWGVEGGESGRCESCRRLRLTSDAKIWPCLFNETSFDIRKIGVREALLKAIGNKPLSGKSNNLGQFYSIGG